MITEIPKTTPNSKSSQRQLTFASTLSRRDILRISSLTTLSSMCGGPRERVVVFHAGSVARLFLQISKRFEQDHPSIRIDLESSGSLDAIRKVTDLGKKCNILVSADHRLLYDYIVPKKSKSYYLLLGNEIVLAGSAKNHGLLNREFPWYSHLLNQPFGISDPTRDPAGYFTHMVWKLSETYYKKPGLYNALTRHFDPRWMRPKSSELLALLQAGVLDFAFIYLSSALQNKLPYLRFPPQISLGDPAYKKEYSQTSIKIPSKDAKKHIEIQGAQIRAGVALLTPSSSASLSFLEFLIGNEAQTLLIELGYRKIPVQKISYRR